MIDGHPVQVINETSAFKLPVSDPGEINEVSAWAEREAHRPFDLTKGPLLRANLLRLGQTEHVLLLTLHHIVSDGWSMGVFVRELAALYEAYMDGLPRRFKSFRFNTLTSLPGRETGCKVRDSKNNSPTGETQLRRFPAAARTANR